MTWKLVEGRRREPGASASQVMRGQLVSLPCPVCSAGAHRGRAQGVLIRGGCFLSLDPEATAQKSHGERALRKKVPSWAFSEVCA